MKKVGDWLGKNLLMRYASEYLDRFGRLVETIWKIGSDQKVHSTYGRNRFGGVVWRKDDKAHAVSKTDQDNFYWYDGLYQVQQHQRGELNAYQTGITSPVQEEGWSYDEMGNWLAYDTQVPSLAQTRAYNLANQITSITNPSSVVQPNYDFAGNMTTMPKAGDWTTECTLKWDAWQRLVEITQGTDAPIRYTYDALTRRIITEGSEYRQYYYDDQWRAVEEQVGEEEPEVDCDYVWGVLGRWDLVRRRSGESLATSHFVLKDYLDPVAIADADGEILERYGYDAFGPVRFMDNNFDPTTGGESEYDWSFLFHAEFLDTETGLYNYGYRYYHPQLGRWLSRDPIGEEGGNLYYFVGNAPLRILDIFGLDTLCYTAGAPYAKDLSSFELSLLAQKMNQGACKNAAAFSPTTKPGEMRWERIAWWANFWENANCEESKQQALAEIEQIREECGPSTPAKNCFCESGQWKGTIDARGGGAVLGYLSFKGEITCVGDESKRMKISGFGVPTGFFIGIDHISTPIQLGGKCPSDVIGKGFAWHQLFGGCMFMGASVGFGIYEPDENGNQFRFDRGVSHILDAVLSLDFSKSLKMLKLGGGFDIIGFSITEATCE